MHGTDMPDPSVDVNVWKALFEQTPRIIQWVLTILTGGLFAVAAWAWRMQTKNVERIENQLHSRMDREMTHLHARLDETNHHLMQIVQNTSRTREGGEVRQKRQNQQ